MHEEQPKSLIFVIYHIHFTRRDKRAQYFGSSVRYNHQSCVGVSLKAYCSWSFLRLSKQIANEVGASSPLAFRTRWLVTRKGAIKFASLALLFWDPPSMPAASYYRHCLPHVNVSPCTALTQRKLTAVHIFKRCRVISAKIDFNQSIYQPRVYNT